MIFRKKKQEPTPQLRNMSSWDALAKKYYSTRNVENLSPVLACINVIASSLASLPVRIYRNTDTSREIVADHPAMRVLRNPNDWQSLPDFLQWYFRQCLLYGNAIAHVSDGQLIPIPWGNAHIKVSNAGKVSYVVRASYANAPSIEATASDVMHMRDITDDGIVGRSRVSRAPDVIRYMQYLQDASLALWENGAAPSAAVTTPNRLSDQQRDDLKAMIKNNYQAAKKRGAVLLMENGLTWQGLSTDPNDAQTLETRRWAVAEICRLYEVPPPLIQDYTHNTFTNSITAGSWFRDFTLQSWAVKFQSVFNRLFLDDDHHLELDISVYGKSSLVDRANAYKIFLEHKVLTGDEVKHLEGY